MKNSVMKIKWKQFVSLSLLQSIFKFVMLVGLIISWSL